MSARRSPVERDARAIAAAALWRARRDKRDGSAHDVYQYAIRHREQATTWAVQRGDIPAARREARAVGLLEEAQLRMVARRGRDTAAELAQAGIVPRARVVVVRAGFGRLAAPVGTVVTLEDDTTSPYIYANDDDGHRYLVYARDLEMVPDAPADEPPMPRDVAEQAERRLMDQGYADDEDMVEVPMPHDDEHGRDLEPTPKRRPYRAPLREPGDVWRIK